MRKKYVPIDPKCNVCSRTDSHKWYLKGTICEACYVKQRRGLTPRYRERECYACGTTQSSKWYQNLALGSKRGGEILHELCRNCCLVIIYGTYYKAIINKRKREKKGIKTGQCSECNNNIADGSCKQTNIVNGKELCQACYARITNISREPLPRNKFGMFGNGQLKISEEEYRAYFRERRSKQVLPVKDTSIEVKIQNGLRERGIPFNKHKTFFIRDFIHPVDIFVEPNICIECDGEYFHSRLIYKGRTWIPLQRDLIIDHELEQKGMKVIRLSEWDINNNYEWCLDFIQRATQI